MSDNKKIANQLTKSISCLSISMGLASESKQFELYEQLEQQRKQLQELLQQL
jgi:hypothetical protein